MTTLALNPLSTLADETLDVLPRLLKLRPDGVPLALFVSELGADLPSIKRAARELNKSGLADLVRRLESRELFLAPLKYRPAVGYYFCAVCNTMFERPRRKYRVGTYYSDRRTCSASCHAALTWKPETKAARCAAISAAHSTPAALARTAAHNKRRWGDPEQHRRLSEQNRREWADPIKGAKRKQTITAVQRRPESRALYSAIRKEWWKDPAMRAKMIEAAKRAKNTPEFKAYFSELCRQRWRDPAWRKKWLPAVRRNAAKAGRVSAQRRKERKQTQEGHAS